MQSHTDTSQESEVGELGNQETKSSILGKQHTFTLHNQENQLMVLILWFHSHASAEEQASLYRMVAD